MKALLLVVLLACAYMAAAGTLVDYSPLPVYAVRYTPRPVKRVVFDPTVCGNEVDIQLRYKHWSYLPSASLSYVTHITDHYGYLFIHQYRNYIGTFYAITRYGTPSRKISYVSFCRLGDGFDLQHTYFEPFYVRPFTISLDLGYGVYSIPRWAKNQKPNWSWKWARGVYYKEVSVANFADAQCALFDKYTRKNYWYYLDGAVTVSAENSLFGKYCYCTHSYVNRVGLWQVIGYYGPRGSVVSTFVRLGDGYEPKVSRKVKPFPSFNTWHFG